MYNFPLNHFSFRMRKDDDGQRNYLSLPACIAPLKASVLPLSNNEEFAPIVKIISKSLTEAEISHKIDETSGSIGKRYARTGTYFKKGDRPLKIYLSKIGGKFFIAFLKLLLQFRV